MTTKGSCSAEDLVGRFVPVSCTHVGTSLSHFSAFQSASVSADCSVLNTISMDTLVSFPQFPIDSLSARLDCWLGMCCDTDHLPAPYGSPHRRIEKVVWSLNESFAGEPSAETEKMWKSLIPKGRAFVQHPKLAKEIKSMSVFHELHCLVSPPFYYRGGTTSLTPSSTVSGKCTTKSPTSSPNTNTTNPNAHH